MTAPACFMRCSGRKTKGKTNQSPGAKDEAVANCIRRCIYRKRRQTRPEQTCLDNRRQRTDESGGTPSKHLQIESTASVSLSQHEPTQGEVRRGSSPGGKTADGPYICRRWTAGN